MSSKALRASEDRPIPCLARLSDPSDPSDPSDKSDRSRIRLHHPHTGILISTRLL